MKVVVLMGSRHPGGTTMLLADEFSDGADEAGHEVERFDVAWMDIKGCTGCKICEINGGKCSIHDDEYGEIKDALLDADAIAFVTPIYWFGMTSQLKAVIDRFHAIKRDLAGKPIKTTLITSCTSIDPKMPGLLEEQYEKIVDYMGWENVGELAALDCKDKIEMAKTDYAERAHKMGANLR